MNRNRQPAVITCKALEPYFREHMPAASFIDVYDISLHVRPDRLRQALQAAIDRVDGSCDPIYLGYGLCSQSVVGLSAKMSRLVVFTADDCIGIFMGHHESQKAHSLAFPGTYYLCRGWIGEGNGSVFDEHKVMEERFGRDRADKLMTKMLSHYTRLVHIIMPGSLTLDSDREYAKEKALLFNLEYMEIEGTDVLVREMLAGRFNSNMISFTPGDEIALGHIMNRKKQCPMEVA